MKLTGLMVIFLLLVGCANKQVTHSSTNAETKPSVALNSLPDLGPARKLEAGVLFHEVLLQKGPATSKLWVYLPERPRQAKIPCVIIAAAGSRLFHGKSLGEGDRPEHLPYVRAGFAVIAYEIDGPLGVNPTEQEAINAARAFQNAEAGLANARSALDYVSAKIPQIDTDRIYTAGHSSAATLSLLVAEHEPRIKACIAYAPVTNILDHLGRGPINSLSSVIPDFREFLTRSSPHTDLSKLTCPLFLFHSEEDSVVPIAGTVSFAEEVKKTNPSVTFVRATTGDHYESMIEDGIPQAIQWLKKLK